MDALRRDKDFGTLLLCVIMGFSLGAPANLFLASCTVLAAAVVNWVFFADEIPSRRHWWLSRIILPVALIVYLIRSYLAI